MSKPSPKARSLADLVREVMNWHSDPESTEYNECDQTQCMWCENAAKALRSAAETGCKVERAPYTEGDGCTAEMAVLTPTHEAAFAAGWRTAANWMERDDLRADVGSPAYRKDMAEAIARIAVETPIAPNGDWLWGQLMDWCKRRRVHPSDYNDLFTIVDAARSQTKSKEEAGG